jgi:hypothetical protein
MVQLSVEETIAEIDTVKEGLLGLGFFLQLKFVVPDYRINQFVSN